MRDSTRLTVAAIALIAAVGTSCDGSDGESVEITAPEDGASVEGNVVELAVDVSGIEIAPTGDGSGGGDSGQFHVFVDREPVAPGDPIPTGEPDIVQTTANPIQLTGLSVGRHRLAVVLGDHDRERLGDAVAETSVDVKGPSIDLTAPAAADMGTVIQVEIGVEGVDLAESADEGAQLHLFVNKDPTPAGEPIPTDDPAIVHTTSRSVAFPADLFKKGNNTIWVMLGQPDNTASEPLVLDKADVEVR